MASNLTLRQRRLVEGRAAQGRSATVLDRRSRETKPPPSARPALHRSPRLYDARPERPWRPSGSTARSTTCRAYGTKTKDFPPRVDGAAAGRENSAHGKKRARRFE